MGTVLENQLLQDVVDAALAGKGVISLMFSPFDEPGKGVFGNVRCLGSMSAGDVKWRMLIHLPIPPILD